MLADLLSESFAAELMLQNEKHTLYTKGCVGQRGNIDKICKARMLFESAKSE
jgi:hypothetical protein